MTDQLPLFNAGFSQLEMEVGIGRATFPEHRRELLEQAKEKAKEIAFFDHARCISADDLVFWYAKNRHIDLPAKLGNAMGSIFRGKDWEFTGRYVKSARARSHRNLLRVWRLKDGST